MVPQWQARFQQSNVSRMACQVGADTTGVIQRMNVPSHNGPSATPESEQKFQKNGRKAKKPKSRKIQNEKKFG